VGINPGQQEPSHIRQAITLSRGPDARLSGDQVKGAGDVLGERVWTALAVFAPPLVSARA